ncbi:MAG: histone deacetylase family protein, partial [Methylomonas sp.]|nr:histone deacetylase family protein [Methylomonas sp.]
MKTLYYSHDDYLKHDTGIGHPENARRLLAIDQALATPDFDDLVRMSAPLPDDILDKLALIHSQTMIKRVLHGIPSHGYHHFDGDTVASPGSKAAALRAVAAVCDAVDQVWHRQANRAFCAVRPPGHHAMPDHPMGFCLFNNVAIAAEYARRHCGLTRVAIVDFDVHHGNGTQTAFYDQPQVFYASTHQSPHYPGTGHSEETGRGNIVNVPLPAGTAGEVFRARYQNIILPKLAAFKPQLLLLSAGFDAHRDDPLASLQLVEDDYRWLTRELVAIAKTCCDGRIVSALEGG